MHNRVMAIRGSPVSYRMTLLIGVCAYSVHNYVDMLWISGLKKSFFKLSATPLCPLFAGVAAPLLALISQSA